MRLAGGRDTCLNCYSSAPCSLTITKPMAVPPSVELANQRAQSSRDRLCCSDIFCLFRIAGGLSFLDPV
jgi:hypothetical protein